MTVSAKGRAAWLRAGDVTRDEMERLYHASGGVCAYCCALVRFPRFIPTWPVGFDHFIPKEYGGANTIGNLLVCCGTCNVEKGRGLFLVMPTLYGLSGDEHAAKQRLLVAARAGALQRVGRKRAARSLGSELADQRWLRSTTAQRLAVGAALAEARRLARERREAGGS